MLCAFKHSLRNILSHLRRHLRLSETLRGKLFEFDVGVRCFVPRRSVSCSRSITYFLSYGRRTNAMNTRHGSVRCCSARRREYTLFSGVREQNIRHLGQY